MVPSGVIAEDEVRGCDPFPKKIPAAKRIIISAPGYLEVPLSFLCHFLCHFRTAKQASAETKNPEKTVLY